MRGWLGRVIVTAVCTAALLLGSCLGGSSTGPGGTATGGGGAITSTGSTSTTTGGHGGSPTGIGGANTGAAAMGGGGGSPPWTGADLCPGEPLLISPNQHLVASGSTMPSTGDYEYQEGLGCGKGGLPPGRDRVYGVVPSADGTLTVSAGWDLSGMVDLCTVGSNSGCWDRALYAYATGQCPGAPIACSDDGDDWMAVEEISFPVLAHQHYAVVIDGWWYDPQFPELYAGTYHLHLTLAP